MRVCVDANILISFLLRSDPESTPRSILQCFILGEFELVVPETTITAVLRSIRTKPYLVERISDDAVSEMTSLLEQLATIVPDIDDPIPRVTRGPKDDYLLAHAILEEVDYLVTGDRDLLVIGDAMDFRIVTPSVFMRILDATSPDYSSENGG